MHVVDKDSWSRPILNQENRQSSQLWKIQNLRQHKVRFKTET